MLKYFGRIIILGVVLLTACSNPPQGGIPSLDDQKPVSTAITDYDVSTDDSRADNPMHTKVAVVDRDGEGIPIDLLSSIEKTIRKLPNPVLGFEGNTLSYQDETVAAAGYNEQGPWSRLSLMLLEIPDEIRVQIENRQVTEWTGPSRPVLAYHNSDGTWTVGLRFTQDYLNLVQFAPESLINAQSKKLILESTRENTFY